MSISLDSFLLRKHMNSFSQRQVSMENSLSISWAAGPPHRSHYIVEYTEFVVWASSHLLQSKSEHQQLMPLNKKKIIYTYKCIIWVFRESEHMCYKSNHFWSYIDV